MNIRELIQRGREQRNLEYKQSVSWNEMNIRSKLIKTVIAMSNLRDGGVLLIGMKENGEDYEPEGMTDADFATFGQDVVSAGVNAYADPHVEMSVIREVVDGKKFVAIEIAEFDEFPVVCRTSGAGGLKPGALYVRPRRMNETAEVSNQAEMREVLDLALEKRVRRFFETLARFGIPQNVQVPSVADAYDAELGDLK